MSQGDRIRGSTHRNLVDSSRQLFEFDPGATIEADQRWLFGAGRSSHPAISNAAFRRDDGVDPGLLLERARAFFEEMRRGFSLWVRDGVAEDRDLIAAAEAAGLRDVYALPEMVLPRRAEEARVPDGVELRPLGGPGEAEDFWRVATASYASNGFPPEVFAFYEDHERFHADNVAAFLAYEDEAPLAIAMTVVSEGVAGVYWVGTVAAARGRGLGRALTAAATNAGFDLGAEVAALQASPMGEPIYRAMGYRETCTYRLLMSPRPS